MQEITNLGESSTGLSPRLAAVLSYSLTWISGIIFWVLERPGSYVRFHARQSVFAFLPLCVLALMFGWNPFIQSVVLIGTFILWVIFMVKAYQGERWKLPIIGDWAEEKTE